MSTVAAILKRKNRSPITVESTAPVIKALQIMSEQNIGSVIVMDEQEYKGIMTERDYSRKVILKEKDSTSTKVGEIMSTNLPAISPTDSIEHCMQLMTRDNIRYMPVFENGKFSGVISMSDVVKETILMQKETINHLQSYINS